MNMNYSIKLKPEQFISKKASYLIPPSDEEELKCVVIDVLLNEELKTPTDALTLFRLVKQIFRRVDYAVFALSRMRINNMIRQLVEYQAIKAKECFIGTKRTFYIESVSFTNLKAIKHATPNFFNSSDIFDKKKFEEKARKAMNSFLEEKDFKPDPDDCLYLDSRHAKKRSRKEDSTEETRVEDDNLNLEELEMLDTVLYSQTALTTLQLRQVEKYQHPAALQAMRDKEKGKIRNFCSHGTRAECAKKNISGQPCVNVHFKPIIKPHTDKREGDCCYLDTCKQMETCKYVHYSIESGSGDKGNRSEMIMSRVEGSLPSQWINCDIRNFDLGILGKFDVIMADPPWDIHMNLPYGTLSDDEMKFLRVKELQDDGVIFLWVTGRAIEMGREYLELWGYHSVEELVWIKTNQLQRLIRTGRTGHWLNHSKEHCLIGIKGNPKINRNFDCDVLVSEVRETSRKPDEVYELIERLSPKGRKVELFARAHNRRYCWLSLGNQLPGSYVVEQEVIDRFNEKYPESKLEKHIMEENWRKSTEELKE